MQYKYVENSKAGSPEAGRWRGKADSAGLDSADGSSRPNNHRSNHESTHQLQSAIGRLPGMLALETHVRKSGLEPSLLHLVRMRASQINGCAYCLDMHSKDARAAGETEQRLYCLPAWRETPFYSERERAALAWMEAVTLVSEEHVPDEVFELV